MNKKLILSIIVRKEKIEENQAMNEELFILKTMIKKIFENIENIQEKCIF